MTSVPHDFGKASLIGDAANRPPIFALVCRCFDTHLACFEHHLVHLRPVLTAANLRFARLFAPERAPSADFLFLPPRVFAGIPRGSRRFPQNDHAMIAPEDRRNVHSFCIFRRGTITPPYCNNRGPEGICPSHRPFRTSFAAEDPTISEAIPSAARPRPDGEDRRTPFASPVGSRGGDGRLRPGSPGRAHGGRMDLCVHYI